MAIKWDDTPKVTQGVEKMYNTSLFDKKQMMEWEDKDKFNKTLGPCKIFFKNYDELNKLYSNARLDMMGFESAENVADKIETESDELKNYLNRLSDATRADKEQMNQMALTNEAMVELCQQLKEAIIQQGKKNSRINSAGGEDYGVTNGEEHKSIRK